MAGTNLATAYISLAISSTDLGPQIRRALSGANSQVAAAGAAAGEKYQSGFTSKIKSLGTVALATFGVAAVAAGGYAVKFGLDTAMANEKAAVSFETLLGSGDKAQDLLKQLQTFAAATPFEMTDLQTAAGTLLSVGVEADKVIPIMTSLGNVTSGMGTGSEGIKRAMVALQQMNAAGRITAEDLNQLRDAGVPVYDLLAKATGKSKAEIVKLASAGKLGKKELDQMMKALETGKGLERFNGLMEKQSQTLEGTISTLKDNLGQGLAGALQPLMPYIKDAVNWISSKLPDVGLAVKKFIDDVVAFFKRPDVQSVMQNLKGLFDEVFSKIEEWVSDPNNQVAIKQFFDGLIKSIDLAISSLREMWAVIGPFLEGLGRLFVFLWNNALQPILKKIVDGLTWVLRKYAEMLAGLGKVPGFEWAKDAAEKMQTAADKADAFSDALKKIPTTKVVEVEFKQSAIYANVSAYAGLAGRASGGYVQGPGGPTSDSIPVRLSNGEYVLRAKAVEQIGVANLDRMNRTGSGFLEGGRGVTVNMPVQIQERANAADLSRQIAWGLA